MIKEIHRRIKSFNYGYMEQNNKPPALKLGEDSNDLGLNAIKCWCLLCNLPLIFEDLVCPNDQHLMTPSQRAIDLIEKKNIQSDIWIKLNIKYAK